ncbi:MarR family transcriptional regulator [Bacillus sp. FJAT-42376]|uniref:MarR family winged helix-turn-helix transcriptional regulator n=1 Tax=Bacillus sp. FJAT-42376 TaxID=2014076 RepID=UPI000F5043D4|nr:MarR family transcriptional regulator [Bacillus sp. FJAT-42376]AZB41409.1 MarR family transcriptional regulator [Bacillus sp. FJAT-42376]
MKHVNNTNDTEKTEDTVNATQQQYPISFSIFALARSHRALAAHLLREIDLFPGQELLLMQLWQRDRQSQNRLTQALGLDHSTIAKSVKRLQDAGLVTRSRSPEDGRVTLVTLTEAGRELESSVLGAWNKLEDVTSDALTDHEKTLFIEMLNKVALKVDENLKS